MDFDGNRESGLLEAAGREFVSSNRDINALLNNVFNIIVSYYSIERGMISIHHGDEGEISVDIHYGYTDEEVSRGLYRPGEGIIGTVVQTGKPVVIPDIKNETHFLNRTAVNRNIVTRKISFLCVPIIIDKKVIGAISADIINNSGRELIEEVNMLTTISIMISQAVNSRMDIEAGEKLLKRENEELKRRIETGKTSSRIIGRSREMREVHERVQLAAGTDSTVLISGESGTGKELIADAIYEGSRRSGKPYIKVTVASIPRTLIQSELFGYERGDFAGGERIVKGRFEMADGGTIFIDEIGDFDLHLQVQLLRFLQSGTIERADGSEAKPVDVRVIAATRQDLEHKVRSGEFRSDLLYRLNVFHLYSPPLRERKADIMLLADHFLELYSKKTGKNIRRISTDAIDLLATYHWPGNVRELENCIERSVLLCAEDTVRSFHLPPSLQKAKGAGGGGTLEERTDQFEREIIIDSMKASRGNISRSAKELGTTKRILGYRMSKLGIDYRLFRGNEESS